MKPEEVEDLGQAEEVCRRFMAWDLGDTAKVLQTSGTSTGTGRVKAKLSEVLSVNVDRDSNGLEDHIEDD